MARVFLLLAIAGYVIHIVRAAVIPQMNEVGDVDTQRQLQRVDELSMVERYQSEDEVRQTSALLAAA